MGHQTQRVFLERRSYDDDDDENDDAEDMMGQVQFFFSYFSVNMILTDVWKNIKVFFISKTIGNGELVFIYFFGKTKRKTSELKY